jgi:chemotaxis protein histidine kinase CheA
MEVMATETPDGFQKELVDLFVQEAHEWLQNIHVALDELQQSPAPERHAKLIGTISAGVTNLGGSAATINLPDIEQASFEAIPFIEALQDPQKRFSVQDFLSLCKQLGQIHAALIHATGMSFEQDGNGAVDKAMCASLAPGQFLQALHALQKKQKQPSIIAPERNLISSLIEQIEGQIQAGVERIDTIIIQGYLTRVSEAEESFLKAIDERIPELLKRMSNLKMNGDESSSRIVALEAFLQDVAQLRTAAQQVNAGSVLIFFTGLHSLLTVVAQHRMFLAATRVESVTARLHATGGAIRQWVEHGRTQRAAIDQLLTSGCS